MHCRRESSGRAWHGEPAAPIFLSMAGACRVLKTAVCSAKLGRDEELQALRRLDAQARQLERTATGPSLDTFIAGERGRAAALDGRSVFGWEKALARPDKTGVD